MKPTNEEPLAVFRFKPRTAKQLQQLLSPMPALDFLLDLAPEAERGPQPPSDKVKSAPAVLTTTPNLPKPRQISAIIPPSRQVLLQPYESPLAPPSVPSFGSINNPATGPLPSKQTASLAQKLGQSLAQANDSTPPLAPPSGSMISFPSPVEQWLARLEDYKASRSSSALQGPVFSVQASLGQLGRKLHRVSNFVIQSLSKVLIRITDSALGRHLGSSNGRTPIGSNISQYEPENCCRA